MLDDLVKERLKKLGSIRDAGRDPYPIKSRRNTDISDSLKNFSALSRGKNNVTVGGRVMSMRDQGGVAFLDVYDGTGTIQTVAMKKGTNHFSFWKENLDIGDFIEIRGKLFKTKRGQKSISADSMRMLSKSIRPVPAKWYGLKDEEERLRKRYLDMFLDADTKAVIEKRSEVIMRIRKFLWENGFMEVETPVLQPIPGGALARPFVTHHNALGSDFYLRIAPELYLKKLLVGGFNKVFEIGRVFRNEGIDRDHNPEFTMLELYWAYQDARGLVTFVKKVLKPFVGGIWREISYIKAIEKYGGRKVDITKVKSSKLDELFKKTVRPKLIKPTIVYDIPKSLSPLSKSKEDNPFITDRFQLIIDGMEIVNGFSELNDPIDQRERMEEQEKLYRAGDEEASRLDEDFLEAIEYGMPPAAGVGIGIDRLVAVYSGKKSIKDVIIFPTLRSKRRTRKTPAKK